MVLDGVDEIDWFTDHMEVCNGEGIGKEELPTQVSLLENKRVLTDSSLRYPWLPSQCDLSTVWEIVQPISMSRRITVIAAALSVLALGSPLDTASANPLANNLYNSGVDKYEQGDYQGAIADYTKALEINPDDVKAYSNRGVAKRKLKDYQGAITDYNKVIDIDPQEATAYSNRGNIKGDLKDYQGAIADYDKAIKISPQYATAYYNRGVTKRKLKDAQGAIADYTKALEINPQYPDAHYNRGVAKGDLKDYQGAIADYDKAIKINPNDAMAYGSRGYARVVGFQDRNGACSDYKKAVSLGSKITAKWLNSDKGGWCRNMHEQ